MESPGVYKVVIESSNGQDRYLKEYIGPATGEDHAVEQARTVFKERPDDRLIKVEASRRSMGRRGPRTPYTCRQTGTKGLASRAPPRAGSLKYVERVQGAIRRLV